MINEYNLIFEEFKLHYPTYAEEVREWYPIGRKEIGIKLKNDKFMVYSFYGSRLLVVNEDNIFKESMTESEWRDSFSKRLSNLMRIKFFSVDRLSNETGISNVTVSKYVCGKTTPSAYNARKIARALDVSIVELI